MKFKFLLWIGIGLQFFSNVSWGMMQKNLYDLLPNVRIKNQPNQSGFKSLSLNFDDGSIDFLPRLRFPTHDGYKLSGSLLLPKKTTKDSLIIFINSWAVDRHEYLLPAIKFAKKGYRVLSYTTRGFGDSGGEVDIASYKDLRDFQNVVKYVHDKVRIPVDKLATIGISYGGVISLLAAAKDSRVRTVVSMSGGYNIFDSLFGEQTPRLAWGGFLIFTGNLLGRISSKVNNLFLELLGRKNLKEIKSWADVRSPLSYLSQLDKNKPAILLSHNWSDYLFSSNLTLDFFNKLKTPKELLLNQGVHASAEVLGMAKEKSYIWERVEEWIDKSESPREESVSRLTMQVRNDGRRESYDSFTSMINRKFFLDMKSEVIKDKLPRSFQSKEIIGGIDSKASTGIPLLSALFDSHFKNKVTLDLDHIHRLHGIVQVSDPLEKEIYLRGEPKLNIWIRPHVSQASLVAYLYEVVPSGKAYLVTHGVVSKMDLNRFKYSKIDFSMISTAYDFSIGSRFAVAIDTADKLYAAARMFPYRLRFLSSPTYSNQLILPTFPY